MDKTLLLLLEDYIQLRGLTKSFTPLLYELISIRNRDGKIIVNASLKRDIGTRIKATVGSIDNMITRLVEAEILIRIDRGMYAFSSELVGLSYMDEDTIKMTITYNNENKNIEINGGEN
ncbi:hypothetical protein [Clostridium sp.]|jgi:hypothetical protein|uniref:hypothetical protein n=1 Tax=Clostridium sp. TaxID=1506 RepID=UPI003EED36AE